MTLTWSSQKPTQDGWWLMLYNGAPQAVLVQFVFGKWLVASGAKVQPLADIEGVQWAKIPLPDEPK